MSSTLTPEAVIPAAVAEPAPETPARPASRPAKAAPPPLDADGRRRVAGAACGPFKLACDPTRLRILLMLAAGEVHVGAMCEELGQGQPAVSHHVALARVSGLVECDRRGKFNFYTLTDTGRPLVEAARLLASA